MDTISSNISAIDTALKPIPQCRLRHCRAAGRTEADVAALRSDVDEVKAASSISRARPVRPSPSRIAVSGSSTRPVKGFVDGYLRPARSLNQSLNTRAPGDGGYAVPRVIDAMIARELKEISPIRAIAQVVQTGSAGYRKLVSTGGTASGWVSETAGRPETDAPQFAEISPPTGELFANPAASQTMLDDAGFDLKLAGEQIAMEFARAGAAFVGGTGADQPEGSCPRRSPPG